MKLSDYQATIVQDLLSGGLSTQQFNAMRSNSRRYNNLSRSIDLAIVFEVYKYRVKHAKERDEKGSG